MVHKIYYVSIINTILISDTFVGEKLMLPYKKEPINDQIYIAT